LLNGNIQNEIYYQTGLFRVLKLETTYACAWSYVQLANEYKKPFEPPVNMATMYNIIGEFLKREPTGTTEDFDFEAFMFDSLGFLTYRTALLEDSKLGLIEYRILYINGAYSLFFPAFVNCGWQTLKFKYHLENNTFLHSYAKTKEDAIKVFDRLREGNHAASKVSEIAKSFSRPITYLARTTYECGAYHDKPVEFPVSECHDLYWEKYDAALLETVYRTLKDDIRASIQNTQKQ
jgi:hypothetical protein